MKLQDLLKDLELGKVYTDKDRKPFNCFSVSDSTSSFNKSFNLIILNTSQ